MNPAYLIIDGGQAIEFNNSIKFTLQTINILANHDIYRS